MIEYICLTWKRNQEIRLWRHRLCCWEHLTGSHEVIMNVYKSFFPEAKIRIYFNLSRSKRFKILCNTKKWLDSWYRGKVQELWGHCPVCHSARNKELAFKDIDWDSVFIWQPSLLHFWLPVVSMMKVIR